MSELDILPDRSNIVDEYRRPVLRYILRESTASRSLTPSCRTNSAESRDRIYRNDIQFEPCAGRGLLSETCY